MVVIVSEVHRTVATLGTTRFDGTSLSAVCGDKGIIRTVLVTGVLQYDEHRTLECLQEILICVVEVLSQYGVPVGTYVFEVVKATE